MTKKTALQTANELLASNSATRAWDIANGQIPSVYSSKLWKRSYDNPFGPDAKNFWPRGRLANRARFWMAVAHWIALSEMRKARA